MKLFECVDRYILYCRYERNLRPKTIRAYKTDLEQFLENASSLALMEMDSIGKEFIQGYLQDLTDKFKPRTAKRKIASLNAFFSYLEYEDAIAMNPLCKMRIKIKIGRELPRGIGIRIIRKLFKCAYKQINRLGVNPSKTQLITVYRDIAICELLFASGMRVSELSGIKEEDIDTWNGTIRVLGKGEKERVIPICGDAVIQAIESYRKHKSQFNGGCEYLLVNRVGKRMSEQSIRSVVSRVARMAGINSRITPHMFRHAAATLLRGNGMDIHDIQHLLGHSSIQTTMIYTHVDAHAHCREIKKRHPRNSMTF